MHHPTPVLSIAPIDLPAVQVRASAPAAPAAATNAAATNAAATNAAATNDGATNDAATKTGAALPLIVFSHGFGQSMRAYQPLADHWAANGFVVVQPTHLDSRTLGVGPDDPRYPDIWRIRVQDLRHVLDELDRIEAAAGVRIDRNRIAVAGHSWGGQTASMLLGARVAGDDADFTDPRVKAGVLLATTGTGGPDLTPFAAEHFPFMSPEFGGMTTPALVVAGDKDQSALSTRGPDWFTDVYHLSPGPKALLTLFGAEHSLGGIVGESVTETTDESPSRVALIQRITTGYLHSVLGPAPADWTEQSELGVIESK
ncbi:alpha/beta fold hydrolase [Actinoplanes sp. NPDC051861]|uniref:alpha/beta hydrolase family protein n=1 Tax=Actinoplanes sp. NPDC051861 TaxID=3155170 RepID=UPI00343E3ED7